MKNIIAIILAFITQECIAQKSLDSDFWIRKCINNDSCGYIDKSGEWVINPGKYSLIYTDTFRTISIVYSKRANDFVGINKKEKILYHVHSFDNGPDEISEGLYRIVIKKKYGFADNDGIVISPNFDFVFPFSQGVAVFVMGCRFIKTGESHSVAGGKWGYIGRSGKILIAPRYEWAGSFKEGKAQVVLNGKRILIDQNFKQIGVW